MTNYEKGDVVQFNERHRWCGCLGVVDECRPNKIMVGVALPDKGTAYIFAQENEIEYIGKAELIAGGEE